MGRILLKKEKKTCLCNIKYCILCKITFYVLSISYIYVLYKQMHLSNFTDLRQVQQCKWIVLFLIYLARSRNYGAGESLAGWNSVLTKWGRYLEAREKRTVFLFPSSVFVMSTRQLLYIRLGMVCSVLLPEKQQSISLAGVVWFVQYIIIWWEFPSCLCTALCSATLALSWLLSKFSCSVNWCMLLQEWRYAKGYQQKFIL